MPDIQVTPVDAPERRGMDRRTMIKAAGIAGAAAWTAPVIIDSLSSPAAAGSAPCNFYVFQVDRQGGGVTTTCSSSSVASGLNCPTSNPTGLPTATCPGYNRVQSPLTPVNFTSNTCTGGLNESVTLTINTPGCTIVGKGFTDTTGMITPCNTAPALEAVSSTSETFTQFPVLNNGRWWIYLAITCG